MDVIIFLCWHWIHIPWLKGFYGVTMLIKRIKCGTSCWRNMMIDSPCPIILFIGGLAKEDWSPFTWKLRNNLPNVVWKWIIRRKYKDRHNKLHCFQPYKNWQLTVEIISYRSYITVIFCNAQLLYRCRRRKVLEYFLNVDLSWDWIKNIPYYHWIQS